MFMLKFTISQYFFTVFPKLLNIDNPVSICPYSQISVLYVLIQTFLTTLYLRRFHLIGVLIKYPILQLSLTTCWDTC